jgi:TolB-like protein/DNA-binding winged helix-turn-helix (wHTH) protein
MTPLDEAHPSDVVRFAVFEADLRSGELRKSGVRIKLQDQPFRLLRILLAHPGEVVTREELQRQIWPSDTFVDFDRGLNNAVKRLREALGDTADAPRYIETLPKRGYRFIGTLRDTEDRTGTVPDRPAGTAPPKSTRRGVKVAVGALALAILLSAVGLAANIGGLRDRWWKGPVVPVAAPSIHSLAVIPLTNLSADPAQEYFSDGITDALITELAQIRTIRVISRTSVMRYKRTTLSLPQIARELGVDGIVEGTIQRAGDRVRITAQLVIYAPSEKHLWAAVYERDLRDVIFLERDLTQEIARKVKAQVISEGQPPLPQPRTVSIQALDDYLQGKHHLARIGRGGGDDERKQAAPYFQHAIDLDPNFVQAYRGLADAHCYLLLPRREEDVAITRKAEQRVAELDPNSQNSSEACLELARAKLHSEDLGGAEQEYRRCIELTPNDEEAHRAFARFLGNRGRFDESWKEYLIAQHLDPNPDSADQVSFLADAMASRGDCDHAMELAARVLESQPGDAQTHLLLSGCYKDKHMYREAIEELGRHAALWGYPEVEPHLRRAFAVSGYTGALRQYVQDIEQLQATQRLYIPTYLAEQYLELGDKDRAFHWLEEAYTLRNSRRSPCSMDPPPTGTLGAMRRDPRYSSDPRFLDLLRRIRFPQ